MYGVVRLSPRLDTSVDDADVGDHADRCPRAHVTCVSLVSVTEFIEKREETSDASFIRAGPA